jgi:hypothetical protein
MTRLYIELHRPEEFIKDELAMREIVIRRAKQILHPFHIEWKSIGEPPFSEVEHISLKK